MESILGSEMVTASGSAYKLQSKGQAMPPSSKNDSDSPRYPINTRGSSANPVPGSLAAAILAVGRAKPNTPEEKAKVRRYIIGVAGYKGWSDQYPVTGTKKQYRTLFRYSHAKGSAARTAPLHGDRCSLTRSRYCSKAYGLAASPL